MIVVFGGMYQGKLDFVREKFHISETDIYYCSKENPAIDTDKKVICGLESFIFALALSGETDVVKYFENRGLTFKNNILICSDISQGIVPTDKNLRLWREMTGKTMTYLCSRADRVYRVFCGIGDEIK